MSDSDGGASGGVLDRVRGSYAAKLVVAFLVLTLIVAGIGGNTVIATQDAVRDSTQDQLRRTAELQAETLSRWVGSMRKEAVLLSSKPALRADDPADVTPFLNGELSSGRLSDSVAALHVVEPKDGLLTVTASTSDAFVGVHPAQQGVPWAGNLSFDATTDTIVSAPFEAPNGKFVFAVISPVPGTDRKLVMMVSLAARSEGLTQPSENGATVVVDGRGTTVLSTNVSAVGTPHGGTADGVDSEPVQRGLAGESGARVVDTDGNRVAVGYAPVAGTDWVVTSRVPAQQAFAVSRMVGRDILLLLGATLLGLVVIGGVVGHRTLRPLRELSETAAALERGELDTEIETGRTDEIGDLYRGFDEMRASLRDRIAEAERATEAAERERERIAERSQRLETLVTRLCRAMEAAANGDLTIRVETDAEIEEMEELLTRFNGLMASMEETVTEVRSFADQVADATEDVAVGTDQIETASREVAESVETISADAESQRDQLASVSEEMSDLSATVEEVAASADSVEGTARAAADEGEAGREAAAAAADEMADIVETADDTIDRVERLDAEMERIGETVELIRTIAEETNLLAINASIEAAHADSDGDGFAVVAQEVKNLAEEAEEATEEVETSIAEVQAATDEAVTGIREMGDRIDSGAETVEETVETLRRIVDRVEEATDGITEISRVTDEQAATTEEVVTVVEEVADTSRETAGEAGDVSAAAEEQTTSLSRVAENVGALADRADDLQTALDQFDTTADGEHTTAGRDAHESAPDRANATPDGGHDERQFSPGQTQREGTDET